MKVAALRKAAVETMASPSTAQGTVVGRVNAVDERGRVLVTWRDAQLAIVARLASATVERDPSSLPGKAVLLVFENGDPDLPVIVGLVRDSIAMTPFSQDLGAGRPPAVEVDKRRLLISASDEIVLRCGQGSITLLADGRIILKGVDIVSRASRANKIRGASVAIN